MKIRRASLFWFLGIHALAVAAILLFPYYRLGAGIVFSFFPSCLLHDVFHIYCPLCGGTRAVDAILHFHFPEALRFNPLVVTFLLLAAIWYGIAWVRLFLGKRLLAPGLSGGLAEILYIPGSGVPNAENHPGTSHQLRLKMILLSLFFVCPFTVQLLALVLFPS